MRAIKMTGKDKKMNFPIVRNIRLNQKQNDKWDPKNIRAFLEGKAIEKENIENIDLLDKLVFLMIKAGINSETYGIDIKESEIQPIINRIVESGKLG